MQPRIVLDTSVIATALRSACGAGNALLRLVAQQKVVPLVTPALFLEYEDVLKRPEQCLVTGLDVEAIDRFLAALASACEPVEIQFQWRPQLRDASDEMVLETAINGRAYALVTYNVRDFLPAAGRFGLRVARPGELLKEIHS
ncbi:putative toxin-antitoxin system toxin component, PIN family [Burkholderia sp. b14]|uniref:putative toxin-antitoxin system toxin component, PIN family n=1 Tax=Mycetohabitans TaxID=2571159 RepID=UPI00095FBFBA|nr:putative toxin-antitoxin system toxin component, PIN family [Mycetohabitans sp. B7]MCG1040915.1 putative toxin-antitoxin system toxin component, PIN family [Mycetohabitans sp. B7]SIT65301.1 putative toxin-antitoxin system toxin component, PIN family [Burkholderia sp. b14]